MKKEQSGPAAFGELAASLGHRTPPAVKWIRRGYEAGILDELNAFYAARPRPWRPARSSACGPTRKERLKIERRRAGG